MQNIYVIEDNFLHQRFIENTIHEFAKDYSLIVRTTPITSPLSFVKQLPTLEIVDTDLFFIDIDLNTQYSGIDIAERIRKTNAVCKVIFITSFVDKGIDIITRNITPFDYIHKTGLDITQTKEQLRSTLKKVFTDLHTNRDKFLILKNEQGSQIFSFADINYIQTVKGNRFSIYLETIDQEYLLNESFSKLKDLSFPQYFLFLKSYILNLKQIKSINRKLGIITFKNDSEIYASIKILSKVKQTLDLLP
ncbi:MULTISPECIES: LytR/AlgR family response regulator transcription factor [unclassified Enterococcus]|jgi:two-component system response regulator AgrA|uniref:LytR/AlgR family response regulator transcription factor n=1 Tax=unclassified Enterococcus TaxID=2608891 RepID=UPI003D29FFCF